jgi:uncharacterized protein with ParB-like and HNH nuclease domain
VGEVFSFSSIGNEGTILMKANETRVIEFIEGTKQYVVPLFQRPYSWKESEWRTLWQDICDLYDQPELPNHFIGSMVTMQADSSPQDAPKYVIIDGQQRLTTLFLLLAAIRDCAREVGSAELAEEIHDTLLINKYKRGEDRYRLNPTQSDRAAYRAVIDPDVPRDSLPQSEIVRCYRDFCAKLRALNPMQSALEGLKTVVATRLIMVSIVLGENDNAHLVFESLNAKGRPLTQADLIRNYILMRVPPEQQEAQFTAYWEPMQTYLSEGDSLTEFIRHYLMRDGAVVKTGNVYFALRQRIAQAQKEPLEELKQLHQFSAFYRRLLYPEQEPNRHVREALARLKRIEMTTAYPFLLNCYADYESGALSDVRFAEVLHMLENFLVRRFVCNRRSSDLNKIFPFLYRQAQSEDPTDLVYGIRRALVSRGYPNDAQFREALMYNALYAAGEKQQRTRFILERIERYLLPKEVVTSTLTIEHILPQSPNDWWQAHLGETWEDDHEMLVHTLGNLTLTGYNSELSDRPFVEKRLRLLDSNLQLNRYFSRVFTWRREDIEARGEKLAEMCLAIWSNLGDEASEQVEDDDITGRKPLRVNILGQRFPADSWVKVYLITFAQIAELEPEKFARFAEARPRLLTRNPPNGSARDVEQIGEYYINVRRSARNVYRLCKSLVSYVELSDEDWSVELKAV